MLAVKSTLTMRCLIGGAIAVCRSGGRGTRSVACLVDNVDASSPSPDDCTGNAIEPDNPDEDRARAAHKRDGTEIAPNVARARNGLGEIPAAMVLHTRPYADLEVACWEL